MICIAKRVPFTSTTVIRDKEGRYIMVAGKINERAITLISYYAPNTDQVIFFEAMLKILMPHALGHVIIRGDSNVSLDQALDRTNVHKPILKHTPKHGYKLAQILHSHDLRYLEGPSSYDQGLHPLLSGP